MAYLMHVVDEHGKVLVRLYGCDAEYVLPDGDTMFTGSQVVFCRSCGGFAMGERFQTDAEFEASLNQWREMSKVYEKDDPIFGDGPRKAHEATMRSMITVHNLLKMRKSPPRCLVCSSTDIVPVDESGTWVQHPLGTGKVRVENPCTHVSLKAAPTRHTLEGVRIPEDDRRR